VASGPTAVAPPTPSSLGTAAIPSAAPSLTAPAATDRRAGAGGIHILELFTSQGCSSCPPADSLLAELSQEDNVIPLSFHVDYWNYLGWADPFSQAAWSERQQAYASHLGGRGVYTPQLVIDGRVGMVGSNRRDVERSLAAADATTPTVLTATATWTSTNVRIDVTAPVDAAVWVALYDRSTRVDVPRGENAGTTLQTTNPVRALQRIAKPNQQVHAEIAVPTSCVHCSAVAFAQPASDVGPIIAAINLPRP
jgi:hypothetical protein